MNTLSEEIKELATDESVMWAVGVLRDKGINGVIYDKLLAMKHLPTITTPDDGEERYA